MQTATSVGAVMIATTVLLATSAEAGRVRVSQEMKMETGAKEFVVKGFVETFGLSGKSPAEVYRYNSECTFSYGGNTFFGGNTVNPKADATVMAVVDTVEGQTLFTIHGYPTVGVECANGPASSAGEASMSFILRYDDDGMKCLVRDDTEENDLRDECAAPVDGIADIATTNEWGANRTDGFVLGSLDSWWQLDASYQSFQNIEDVIVRSSDGPDITDLGTTETIRLENVLEVEVDVQPGADDGCLNSDGNGVIPVAILGAREFDVSEVERGTLRFAGLELRVRGNGQPQCSTDYINDDDYLDLICHFYDDPEAWMPGTGRAAVSGELGDSDSIPFYGDDAICVVPRS